MPPSVCCTFRMVLPILFNSVVERKGGGKEEKGAGINVADVVVPEVHLLPPCSLIAAVPAAGVAGALCSK